MASASPNSGKLRFRVRFGPYELDPDARTLRKSGTPIRLPEQPWQVLCALLERPGALVTREQLQERLWPGTHVDFERGLNRAVNRLREVLSDSAEKPRYVETVVGQGYRFIARVEIESPSAPAAVVPDDISGNAVQPAAHAGFPAFEPKPRRTRRAIVAVAVTAVVLAVAGYWWLRPEPHPADLHSVPLTPWPGRAYFPTLSPDGNRMAFQWASEQSDKSHIYVEQIGSGAPPVQLTTGPTGDFFPAWSPDDKYIAFFRHAGRGDALMLVPSIGGPERKVADFPDGAGLPAWSPDSKWLAIAVASPQAPDSIWLVSVSTEERRRLTTSPTTGRGDSWPSVSPDGRSIAFEREVTSYAFAPYVLKLSRDYRPEGQPRELTTMRYSDMGGMAWTADGREVVFSAGPLGNESLFRVLASGRHSPARLAYVLPNADAPIISPVRSRLAYVRGTLNENLWRLDTRTGERKMLGAADGTSNHPQYSPDGRKIAFQSNRSGEWGVWTCNADGSNCMQLNSFGNAFGGTPHWSPDSQWIAFDSRTEGHAQVYVMQADGVGQRRITNDAAEDIAPSFSNDGRWIYFASDRSGSMETWKMPATGGPGVQVTRAGGGPGLESADGKYIYYSKGVAAPLYRMPVKGGAEVQVLPRVEAWCDATWCDTAWCDFAIVRKGIYFTPDGKTIQRQVLSSGNVSTLATVEKGLRGGLCVSPDEAFVVWSQHDHASVELMLVEGFR